VLFNSFIFLFAFLPMVLVVTAAMARSSNIRSVQMLSFSSLVFYAWWKPPFIVLVFLTITINFALGQAIYRTRSTSLLIAGICLNLAPLAFFKYYNFAVDGVALLGIGAPPILDLFLPLAISFLTFEQISYLTDCKRRAIAPASFWDYAFFVSFFPKLIAGPIVRYGELQPQLRNLTVTVATLAPGITLFIIGLGKKVILADSAVHYSDSIFLLASKGSYVSGVDAWAATLAYSAQIYFDFSGYSDMALGLALMFGIRLPINFDSPYKSTSIIDFWRSWHMTLSRFLRDYLYFPLGGGRTGWGRRCSNLTIVMLLGGLWHGAGLNFIVWGGLHAIYLMINHSFRDIVLDRLPRQLCESRSWMLLSWLLTFVAVAVAWVFFRSSSLPAAISLLSAMFGLLPADRAPTVVILQIETAITVALVLCTAFLLPNSMEIMGFTPRRKASGTNAITLNWRASFGWATLIGAIATISVLSLSKPAPFLYFQF
jgi:alginate O-acetyltransferase complex protein AlgI